MVLMQCLWVWGVFVMGFASIRALDGAESVCSFRTSDHGFGVQVCKRIEGAILVLETVNVSEKFARNNETCSYAHAELIKAKELAAVLPLSDDNYVNLLDQLRIDRMWRKAVAAYTAAYEILLAQQAAIRDFSSFSLSDGDEGEERCEKSYSLDLREGHSLHFCSFRKRVESPVYEDEAEKVSGVLSFLEKQK